MFVMAYLAKMPAPSMAVPAAEFETDMITD
jgi:hypothetical protein